MWGNFAAAGAQRLILCRVLENRSLLRRVEAAVPGADITIVRLRAPLQVLHDRLRRREAGDPSWFLDAATALHTSMEQAGLADARDQAGRWRHRRVSIDGFHPPRELRVQRGDLSAEGYYRDSFD
jgi:hypothetical protein